MTLNRLQKVLVILFVISGLTTSMATEPEPSRDWIIKEVERIAKLYDLSVFAEAPAGFDLAMFEEEARKIADIRAQALADDSSASNESALADDDEIQFYASYGFTFLRCSKTHTIPGGGKTIKVKATAKYSHNPKKFVSVSEPVYHVEGTAIANNITFTHVQTKSWINNGGKKANLSATFTVNAIAGGVANTSFADSCRASKTI